MNSQNSIDVVPAEFVAKVPVSNPNRQEEPNLLFVSCFFRADIYVAVA